MSHLDREMTADELIREISSRNKNYNTEILRREFNAVRNFHGSLQLKNLRDVRKRLNAIHPKAKPEKIALICKAMELDSQHKIRDVQILAVLLMYHPQLHGRLSEIGTGEGKTIVIAILAVLFALDKHKVDIVTTSPELAVPQSNQLKSFYQAFGLTSSNIDKGDKAAAYKCDILYGSINEFEGDVLRDEYLKMGIRGKRQFDIVIVDEADSMLVDGVNNMTRLSSAMPGMNVLLPILVGIWIKVNEQDRQNVASKSKNFVYEENLRAAIEDSFRVDDRVERIKKAIMQQIDQGGFVVPAHLKDLVTKHQLVAWIRNAFKAKDSLKLDREYVIEDNEIKIVDQHNSGIVFKDMRWSDGLHQFLQIKHDVQLTCEDLVTNYLANPTFFKRFSKIFGMTGTLGDDATKIFLRKAYGVDCVILPPFKAKRHSIYVPIVQSTEKGWYQAIVQSCLNILERRRAVMIIADSILETEIIKSHFPKQHREAANQILMYKTEKDSEITHNTIQPGQVIITTNICGRGVNIFPSRELNDEGGLHVCLTFLPENSRVEMQNIGRTSRAGNPGSSQIILYNHQTIEAARAARLGKNNDTFQKLEGDMTRIDIKAEIFYDVCELVDNAVACQSEEDVTISLNNEQFRDALREKFSIWLKSNEFRFENDPNQLKTEYRKFKNSIAAEVQQNLFRTENVFFFIHSGIKSIRDGNYDRAISQFTKAIDRDKQHCAFAFVGMAMAKVSLKRNQEALGDLKQAVELINELIRQTDGMTAVCGSKFPALGEKFNRQSTLLRNTAQSIHLAIDGVSSAMNNNQTVFIAFDDWRGKISNVDPRALFADAFELNLRGWLGPVKVVASGWKMPSFMNYFLPNRM